MLERFNPAYCENRDGARLIVVAFRRGQLILPPFAAAAFSRWPGPAGLAGWL